MRTAFVCGTFLWVAVFVLGMPATAQDSPAGPRPTQGNQPGGNPPQQGRGRPSGPIAGPPHDPHDLTGVWNMRGGGGQGGFGRVDPNMTAWGEQQYKLQKSSNGGQYTLQETNDPVITKCFPPGVPRIYLQPFPLQIVQTPKEVIFLYEYDHTVRHIFTDGRKHPDDVTPTYMGDSIGHWEGDTLVVDTVGFNDRSWLDAAGHMHGEKLHVTEKFTRPDSNTLRLEATIDDPDYYTKPWSVVTTSTWAPGQELLEYICQENNRDIQHLVGK
jgi:hypothetical protein